MDLSSILQSAPLWAFAGAVVTQTANVLIAKLRAKPDPAAEDVTNAHANLNRSLQAGFNMMSQELARLREDRERDAEEWDAKEARYQDRIRALEAELERMQKALFNATCPTCRELQKEPA